MRRVTCKRLPLFVVGIVVLVLALVVAAWIFKLSFYRITTGSMEPDFPVGTIVIETSVVPLELHKPITFTAEGETVTHVLVGYNRDGSLITRGIANSVNDQWRTPVYPRDVHGRVLFQILLLSPAFWQSARGIAAGVGFDLIVLVILLRRPATRAYTKSRSSAYSRRGSSA